MADDAPGVMESGEKGENHHDGERPVTEEENPGRAEELAEHDRGESEDLREGVGLTEGAGLEVADRGCGVKDGGHDEDAEIAGEDENRDAAGDEGFVMEDEEQGAEQELVDHRVEILAEQSALVKDAGEEAIEGIGEAGEDEERKGKREALIEYREDQKGYDAQPQKGEQIGRCL